MEHITTYYIMLIIIVNDLHTSDVTIILTFTSSFDNKTKTTKIGRHPWPLSSPISNNCILHELWYVLDKRRNEMELNHYSTIPI